MLLAVGVVVGLLAAFLAGASWRGLVETRWRLAPFCLIGLAIQLVLFSNVPGLVEPLVPYGPAIHLVSIALVLLSLAANWRLAGVPVILVGAALNFAPIALNGGQMPRRAPIDPGAFRNVAPMNDDTRLAFLGDWIDVPFLSGRQFSPGDVLIATGGGLVAYRLARARRIDRSAPMVIGRFGQRFS